MRKTHYLVFGLLFVLSAAGLMLDKSLTPYVLALLLGSVGFTSLMMWWFGE